VSWFGVQSWRQPYLAPALSWSCWRLVRVLSSWRAAEEMESPVQERSRDVRCVKERERRGSRRVSRK
jgi:hypothetical protein